jgi:hypothetical protein
MRISEGPSGLARVLGSGEQPGQDSNKHGGTTDANSNSNADADLFMLGQGVVTAQG